MEIDIPGRGRFELESKIVLGWDGYPTTIRRAKDLLDLAQTCPEKQDSLVTGSCILLVTALEQNIESRLQFAFEAIAADESDPDGVPLEKLLQGVTAQEHRTFVEQARSAFENVDYTLPSGKSRSDRHA